MKKCKDCGLEKIEDDFPIHSIVNGKIFRRIRCIVCWNKSQKKIQK